MTRVKKDSTYLKTHFGGVCACLCVCARARVGTIVYVTDTIPVVYKLHKLSGMRRKWFGNFKTIRIFIGNVVLLYGTMRNGPICAVPSINNINIVTKLKVL